MDYTTIILRPSFGPTSALAEATWNQHRSIIEGRRCQQSQLQAGNHIQRQVEIIPITLDITSVDDVGLRQMGRVFLEAFLQRDGGEARRGFHLDGGDIMPAGFGCRFLSVPFPG